MLAPKQAMMVVHHNFGMLNLRLIVDIDVDRDVLSSDIMDVDCNAV